MAPQTTTNVFTSTLKTPLEVAHLETARRWYGAMLTTCPNCLHVFDQPLSSSCCASRPHASAPIQGSASPPPPPSPPTQPPPLAVATPQAPPLLLSATLQLPPSTVPTTCTLALSATAAAPPLRAVAGMAGGGIVLQQQTMQDSTKTSSIITVNNSAPPQPSPSAPLSFVLPTVPGTPRGLELMPFQWSLPSQQWNIPVPTASTAAAAAAAVHVNVQMPAVVPQNPVPMTPQSETDLERLAATMNALRASGWYYEGLSWQESAEALQATAPGTFLVRDSSDPRFLFSLSVQTDRGPTSIRLHYVCGQFRLDAEPRLVPLMPLFDCVVKLVEYYVELTRNRSQNKPPRDKEQVWVDARGQMYSHIFLRSPLYKKQQLPNLQHLARLAINKQFRAADTSPTTAATMLPLPTPLQEYIKEYPYIY